MSEIAPNFGRFSPSQSLGGRPYKSYTHFITLTSRLVAWKRYCEDTPISPEVFVAHTLNFKAHFKFSRLIFFGGGVPVVVCASKARSICNACKNLRRQHTQGPKCRGERGKSNSGGKSNTGHCVANMTSVATVAVR